MDIRSVPLIVLLLVIAVCCTALPGITRPGLFFGVTVAPEFPDSAEGRSILRQYRLGVWCWTTASIAAALFALRPLFVLLIFVVGFGFSSIRAYRRARRHQIDVSMAVEIDMATRPERIPGGVFALLLPFALLLCIGLWALSPWHPLTGYLVTHWSVGGPDRWARATPRAVIVRLAFSAFWCLIFVATALGIVNASRRISLADPAASGERRFRRRVLQFILLCEYFVVVLGLFSVAQVPGFVLLAASVSFAGVLVIFVLSLIRMGQGSNRLLTSGAVPLGDRSRDAYWKWGVFYFNPDDPAIFVESRAGVGYTLNFGNVWSWVLLGAIIAFPRVMHHLARG